MEKPMTPDDQILQSLFQEPIVLKRILHCEYKSNEDQNRKRFINDVLNIVFENNPTIERFIKNSPFLLKHDGSGLVGQYKDWFWISSEDGYFYYAGKTIKELLSSTNTDFHEIENKEDLINLLNIFTKNDNESEKIINDFLKICNENGVQFEYTYTPVDIDEEQIFIAAIQNDFGFTPEDPLNLDK